MKTIFNCESIAIPKVGWINDYSIAVNVEKNYFTKYGLFIPLHRNGELFIRALNGEFTASKLLTTNIECAFAHINHLGHVWYVLISSQDNSILFQPVNSKEWIVTGFLNSELGNSTAYGYLLKGCETIEKAVARFDDIACDGFYNPIILKVSDIAARLKELDYTEPFFYTRFSEF